MSTSDDTGGDKPVYQEPVLCYTEAVIYHFTNPCNVGDMAKGKSGGKTLEEARRITDDDVINALGGIPANKHHCSPLGVQALQAALADYSRRKSIADQSTLPSSSTRDASA